jgi:hypothetical protein
MPATREASGKTASFAAGGERTDEDDRTRRDDPPVGGETAGRPDGL